MAKTRPRALEFAQERLLGEFKDYNETLDRVQKNLAEYLETKRSGFARFYFLSDDDLIQILSQTKVMMAFRVRVRVMVRVRVVVGVRVKIRLV